MIIRCFLLDHHYLYSRTTKTNVDLYPAFCPPIFGDLECRADWLQTNTETQRALWKRVTGTRIRDFLVSLVILRQPSLGVNANQKRIKAVKVRIQKQGIRLLTRCSSCEHIVARVSGKEPETVSLTLHCHSCSLIENTQSGVHQGN